MKFCPYFSGVFDAVAIKDDENRFLIYFSIDGVDKNNIIMKNQLIVDGVDTIVQ